MILNFPIRLQSLNSWMHTCNTLCCSSVHNFFFFSPAHKCFMCIDQAPDQDTITLLIAVCRAMCFGSVQICFLIVTNSCLETFTILGKIGRVCLGHQSCCYNAPMWSMAAVPVSTCKCVGIVSTTVTHSAMVR